MVLTNNLFRRIVSGIRLICTSVFTPSRPDKRLKPNRAATQKVKVNVDLLTVDIPQEPLGDELSWHNIDSELDVIHSMTDGRITPTYTTLDPPPNRLEYEFSWGLASQGGFEYTPPFFGYATVRIRDPDFPKSIEDPPLFPRFGELPIELRLKIWHHTIQSRLVHYNVTGADQSCLKIDRQLPVIFQVCHESRCEGLQIFDISEKATRPIFFNPKSDILLWTRYPNCPKTFNEDAQRLKKSSTLKNVRHLAILHKYWMMLLSREGPKEVYTAIRKAPNLEVLTLVNDYYVRSGYSPLTHGRLMKLIDICPEDHEVRTVRWEKELRKKEKQKLWAKWDVNLVDREGLPAWKFPEVRFARVVLEIP